MKSSWKKQRLAAKKRSINRNKWIRRGLRSMLTPSAAPVLRETVYTPKGIMYKEDLQCEINKHLNIPTLFKSASW